MRLHIWHSRNHQRSTIEVEWFTAVCGEEVRAMDGYTLKGYHGYEPNSIRHASCLHCLRTLRDDALRNAARYADTAEVASRFYDQEYRRRRRA